MPTKLATLALLITFLTHTHAAEVKTLFDGKSLEGWVVTDCQVEARDGVLLLKEGTGLVRSKEKYGDFVLTWECKPLAADKWDSGVYVRWDLPLPKGRPGPARYQVNMAKGMEGNVQGLKGAESKGLFKPGEWNKFKILAKGNLFTVWINGTQASQYQTDKYPGAAPIGLQIHGGLAMKVAFRNLKIRDLKAGDKK